MIGEVSSRKPLRRMVPRRRGNRKPQVSKDTADSSQPPEQRNATKVDPLVVYVEQSNRLFQKEIAEPVKAMFADLRQVRNYMVSLSQPLPGRQGSVDDSLVGHGSQDVSLVDKARRMDDEAWKILSRAKALDRRFRTQLEKIKKKLTPKGRFETKPKSVARQNAGKLKAASLATRNKTFKEAVQSLKAENYKGSFTIKKGMPVHSRMIELQKAQAASASSACSSTNAEGSKCTRAL